VRLDADLPKRDDPVWGCVLGSTYLSFREQLQLGGLRWRLHMPIRHDLRLGRVRVDAYLPDGHGLLWY